MTTWLAVLLGPVSWLLGAATAGPWHRHRYRQRLRAAAAAAPRDAVALATIERAVRHDRRPPA